jgi:hypothetical protein
MDMDEVLKFCTEMTASFEVKWCGWYLLWWNCTYCWMILYRCFMSDSMRVKVTCFECCDSSTRSKSKALEVVSNRGNL